MKKGAACQSPDWPPSDCAADDLNFHSPTSASRDHRCVPDTPGFTKGLKKTVILRKIPLPETWAMGGGELYVLTSLFWASFNSSPQVLYSLDKHSHEQYPGWWSANSSSHRSVVGAPDVNILTAPGTLTLEHPSALPVNTSKPTHCTIPDYLWSCLLWDLANCKPLQEPGGRSLTPACSLGTHALLCFIVYSDQPSPVTLIQAIILCVSPSPYACTETTPYTQVPKPVHPILCPIHYPHSMASL